jgi:hypothetical protein
VPNNQASGDPTLVGQTYDVAVLLLIPRRYFVWRGDHFEPANISLVSYTQFRDATSGDILPSRPTETLAADLDRVVIPFISDDPNRTAWWEGLKPANKAAEAGALMGAIVAGNPETFRANLAGGSQCKDKNILQSLCIDSGYGPALWAGLSSVLSDNSYKSASFEAPIPGKVTIPTQTLLVADDKTHPIQVLVGGVSGTSPATLAAHLNVMTKTRAGASVVTIPAQSLALDATAHVMTLTFPSLGKSGLSMPPAISPKPPKSPPADNGPTLVLGAPENAVIIERVNCDPMNALCPDLAGALNGHQRPPSGTPEYPFLTLPVQLTSIPKAAPTSIAKLASSGNTIAIDRGSSTGTLPILVSAPAAGLPTGDTLALTVTGAAVTAVMDSTNTQLLLGKNGYALKTIPSAYSIELINLTPGGTITVSVQAIKKDGTTPDGDPATETFTAIPPTVSRP